MLNYVHYNLSASCRATKFIHRGQYLGEGGAVSPSLLAFAVDLSKSLRRSRSCPIHWASCMQPDKSGNYILTSPAKPRKDRAISPAVINEIGVPCNTLGILAWTVCSRIPAMSINATVNP